MADVLFLVIMAAMLGLSVLFIRACDLIVGGDEEVLVAASSDDLAEEMAA